jgi:hypothetical protein
MLEFTSPEEGGKAQAKVRVMNDLFFELVHERVNPSTALRGSIVFQPISPARAAMGRRRTG